MIAIEIVDRGATQRIVVHLEVDAARHFPPGGSEFVDIAIVGNRAGQRGNRRSRHDRLAVGAQQVSNTRIDLHLLRRLVKEFRRRVDPEMGFHFLVERRQHGRGA